ncbi:unnamed protein product [Bursaphelenchus xylophilus]|uniref:(pine wood nematode) hypothetical protein n=1 Tax=Bursaphelenchus xylophilus TaxID=6326 RepID=A0A1I7RI97_BURXY|nr:unnamed protein product [Bursaphelenchus xylophilus]CAG9115062.1 unnamed protein product [Bursaphelenchus xylophilus]
MKVIERVMSLRTTDDIISRYMPETLNEHEYIELGQRACSQIKTLVESDWAECWSQLEWDEADVKVYSRKSAEFEEAKENMLMLVMDLPTSVEHLERLLFPWFEFRVKWDEMLAMANVIERLSEETFVMRHVVKKRLALSSRDAIDATSVYRQDDGSVIMGSTGTEHGKWGPQEGFVRTKQYLGGYYFRPIDENNTKFMMIFCADLNLPIPRFISNMVAKLKPRLMVEKARNLAKAVNKYPL